jgi:hypothetical protein
MYLVNSPKTTLPPRVLRKGPTHRKLSPAQKAALAAGVLNGEVAIKLSRLQIARLAGVSQLHMRKACLLTAAEREAVVSGDVEFVFPALSDAELASIIRNAGIDRVISAACTVEQSTAA